MRPFAASAADKAPGAGRKARHPPALPRALLPPRSCLRSNGDRLRQSHCRRHSSSRRTDWRERPYFALPGFRPVYMANKDGLTRGHARMRSNAGESRDRRTRRRTVMSPLHLAAAVIALAFAMAMNTAAAQAPAPKPSVNETMPPLPSIAGPASPSPLPPGDAFGEQVSLPERTIGYISGHSNWDTAYDTLVDAFKSLHEYLDKQDVKPTGSALTIYTQTDDTGFSFKAALPIAQAPKDPPKGDIGVGPAPSGRALKFVHRGSYDAMDSTSEATTNYLDDNQLEAKDLFIEEYASDPVKTAADKLVVNVFVPVK